MIDDHTECELEHTYDEETPVSVAIVQAIAALENVDPVANPVDLGFTLYDYVDPSALEAVVGDGTGNGAVLVTFEIDDYQVRVEDTGRLVVDYSNADVGPDERTERE